MLHETEKWFATAKPHPLDRDFQVQLGCHFEEIHEMLEALEPADTRSMATVEATAAHVKILADLLKAGAVTLKVKDRVDLLDALADQIVTAVGVGHMDGLPVAEALVEVNRSNNSKFLNGKPLFNHFGKIMKGPDYRKPDIAGLLK
jgi:predicted HAD superfamily Cof-like phosphohydrolase